MTHREPSVIDLWGRTDDRQGVGHEGTRTDPLAAVGCIQLREKISFCFFDQNFGAAKVRLCIDRRDFHRSGDTKTGFDRRINKAAWRINDRSREFYAAVRKVGMISMKRRKRDANAHV